MAERLTERLKEGKLKKIVNIAQIFFNEINEKSLFIHANELTYKLLLSFFPFVIFLMALVGFLDIKANFSAMASDASRYLPKQAQSVIEVFSFEVLENKSPGILSLSLATALFSASGGFIALIRGISKAYGETKKRNFIAERLMSMVLVLILAAVIVGLLLIMIFGDAIYTNIAKNYSVDGAVKFIFGAVGYFVLLLALLMAIIVIYKFATLKKVAVLEALPGATVTLAVWIISSRVFSIYVNNFAKYSMVYGSIAGIVVLMFWLNMISSALLIGAEINALFERYRGTN